MCSIDFDQPTVYRDRSVRARKSHACYECGRAIEPGETYQYATMLYDGFWSDYRTCAHCRVGQEWLGRNCGGWMHHGLREEMEEHADEYRHLRFRMTLFAKRMQRRWRSPSGKGLRAIPQQFPPARIA